LERVFDCITDYMVRDGALWTIESSTDPRREKQPVSLLGPLNQSETAGLLSETVTGDPRIVRRVWRIDSLEAGRSFSPATPISPNSLAWLEREADTLIHPLQKAEPRKVA